MSTRLLMFWTSMSLSAIFIVAGWDGAEPFLAAGMVMAFMGVGKQ